jgi:ferritin-like protein
MRSFHQSFDFRKVKDVISILLAMEKFAQKSYGKILRRTYGKSNQSSAAVVFR